MVYNEGMNKTAMFMKIIIVLVLLMGIFSIMLFCTMGEALAEDIALVRISENEIDFILNEVNERERADNGAEAMPLLLSANTSHTLKDAQRHFLLKDFDNKNAFIYIEFNLGGYVIYDRTGEFIYERTEEGSGPYEEYSKPSKLYYGGPLNYYVKENGSYKNILSGDTITLQEGKLLTENATDNVREIETLEKELLENQIINSYSNITPYATIKNTYLGSKISDSDLSIKATTYFPMVTGALHSVDCINIYDFGSGYGGEDCAMPINRYGSCGLVAMTLAMQYYDKLGIRNMVPDDASDFKISYNNLKDNKPIYIYDYVDGSMNSFNSYSDLSNSYKNAIKSEMLHQELMYRFKGTVSTANLNSSTYGSTNADRQNIANLYFAANTGKNLQSSTIKSRSGSSGLIEAVAAGDPVIVSFQGEYRYENGTDTVGSHAVVCYGYSEKYVGIIHSVQEYFVVSGWNVPNEGTLFIAKRVINNNQNFKVFTS